MSMDDFVSDCIERVGLALFSVDYGECSVEGCACEPGLTPWSYSVGRAQAGMPEFVIIGLDPDFALRLANWAHRRWQVNPPMTRRPARFGHLVRADPLPPAWVLSDWGRMAQWYFHYEDRDDVPPHPDVVQLVWSDHDGHFPDDPKCDRFLVECQPLLARDPLAYPRAA